MIVLDKENEISSLKLEGDKIILQERRRGFHQPDPINQEDPLLGKVCNSNCANSLLLALHIFVDLIIGETTSPPSLTLNILSGIEFTVITSLVHLASIIGCVICSIIST